MKYTIKDVKFFEHADYHCDFLRVTFWKEGNENEAPYILNYKKINGKWKLNLGYIASYYSKEILKQKNEEAEELLAHLNVRLHLLMN
jgi:hypothetical protein